MSIHDELDKAYASEVQSLFGVFFDSVAGAKNKDAELAAAAERFKNGVTLLKLILAKAKEVAGGGGERKKPLTQADLNRKYGGSTR